MVMRPIAMSKTPAGTTYCAASGGELAASLLDRRQGLLGACEWPRANVDAGRFGRDRDLLAGCWVAALARLCCRLETDGQLDELADPYFLRFRELLEDDLFEGVENVFRVGLAHIDALGESARQLSLR